MMCLDGDYELLYTEPMNLHLTLNLRERSDLEPIGFECMQNTFSSISLNN